MSTNTSTSITAAVEARAAELGGEIVQIKRGKDAYEGCVSGLVHWKRPSQYHNEDGFEHVTHLFYVRPGDDVAIFEAGTYGEASNAEAAWARRVGSI